MISLEGLQSGVAGEDRAIAILKVEHNGQTYDWMTFVPPNTDLATYIADSESRVKAEIDAKTAIAKAEGEARSNKIKAEALNQNGGSKVLAREWIEKWDGHLPQVSSGGNMMFNIDSLIKEANSK